MKGNMMNNQKKRKPIIARKSDTELKRLARKVQFAPVANQSNLYVGKPTLEFLRDQYQAENQKDTRMLTPSPSADIS